MKKLYSAIAAVVVASLMTASAANIKQLEPKANDGFKTIDIEKVVKCDLNTKFAMPNKAHKAAKRDIVLPPSADVDYSALTVLTYMTPFDYFLHTSPFGVTVAGTEATFDNIFGYQFSPVGEVLPDGTIVLPYGQFDTLALQGQEFPVYIAGIDDEGYLSLDGEAVFTADEYGNLTTEDNIILYIQGMGVIDGLSGYAIAAAPNFTFSYTATTSKGTAEVTEDVYVDVYEQSEEGGTIIYVSGMFAKSMATPCVPNFTVLENGLMCTNPVVEAGGFDQDFGMYLSDFMLVEQNEDTDFVFPVYATVSENGFNFLGNLRVMNPQIVGYGVIVSDAVLTRIVPEGDGIEDVEANQATAKSRYFNLQGMEISEPVSGFYVKQQGSNAAKVMVK